MQNIKKVAVIGTGVIGAGWIIRCLAHNKIVYAFDKDVKLKKNLISEIKRTWPFVKKLFNKEKLNLKNFYFFTSIEKVLKEADFIQECATENYSLKTKLMSTIGKYAKSNSIIASSAKDITRAWIERWLCKRIQRNETLDRLIYLGPETIKNQLKPIQKNNVINLKKLSCFFFTFFQPLLSELHLAQHAVEYILY